MFKTLPLFIAAAFAFASCASNEQPEATPSASASSTLAASPRPATPTVLPATLVPTTTPESTATLPLATSTLISAGSGPSITISAVGDISLARQVNDWMAQFGAGYPYELIQPLLSGDIVFGNLEGALTDRGEPWPKAFTFRTPPQYAPDLAAVGFDVVALANNHAMDYGVTGLEDTMLALDNAGIRHAGAGVCGSCAAQGVALTVEGTTVAFISCVRSPDEGGGFSIFAWEAVADGTGLFVCDPELIRVWVDEAAKTSDFVVVSIHAGDEYVNAPNTVQREMADAALAAGADVVLGHHAHVVQPVEQRGNQLIVWGMGNFIFDLDQWDLAGIPEPRVAPVMQITLTKGVGVTAWRADAVVLDAEQDRPRPATPGEAAVLDALLMP